MGEDLLLSKEGNKKSKKKKGHNKHKHKTAKKEQVGGITRKGP